MVTKINRNCCIDSHNVTTKNIKLETKCNSMCKVNLQVLNPAVEMTALA